METITLMWIAAGLLVAYLIITTLFPSDKRPAPAPATPTPTETKPDEPLKEFTADGACMRVCAHVPPWNDGAHVVSTPCSVRSQSLRR